MAALREFKCKTCGYSGDLRIGGTRKTHTYYSPFPILCNSCKALSTYNKQSTAEPKCLVCASEDFIVYGDSTRDPDETDLLCQEYRRETEYFIEKVRTAAWKAENPELGEITEEELRELQDEDYSPSWDMGQHICPECETYGLSFGRHTMFID